MEQGFAAALRDLRLQRGITQKRLGRLAGFSDGYISDLEIGRRSPNVHVARGLDEALGGNGLLIALAVREIEAASDPPSQAPRWDDRVGAAVSGRLRPDAAMRDYLARSLAMQRSAEDSAGARLVLPPTLGQLSSVESVREAASGPLHRELLSLEAQYAQFIGWCYQDLNDIAASEQWYARALMLAHEAGDENMIASVLSMRSNAAWGRRDLRRAVDLGEAATRPRATPGVLALSHQQAARAYAAAGDRAAAEHALDTAVSLSGRAAAAPDGEPAWVYFSSERRLEMQRAVALHELGEHRRAIEMLRDAVDGLPAEYRRDRGSYLARLAAALAAAGDRDEASVVNAEARMIADETGSARTLREVGRVDAALAA